MEIRTKPENFTYTYWSIHVLSLMISELETLYKTREDHELYILNHPMFKIFHMSMMYTVVMEYCKLLEGAKTSGNVASLLKLSSVVLHENNHFKPKHELNLIKIDLIRASTFYIKMKKLRDKKFAHSDKSDLATPFKIKSFRDDEMLILKNHFKELTEIHQICANEYDVHFMVSMKSNETESFITQFAKMRKYYKENNTTPWL